MDLGCRCRDAQGGLDFQKSRFLEKFTHAVDDAVFARFEERATALGFDLSELIVVNHGEANP